MEKIVRLEESDIKEALSKIYNIQSNKIKLNITQVNTPGENSVFIVGAEFPEPELKKPSTPCDHRDPHVTLRES